MPVSLPGRFVVEFGLLAPWVSFGATPEAVLEGGVEACPQLGVLLAQAGALGQQLPHQRLERGHVVGERGIGGREGGVHALLNTGSAFG